jgi:subtilisin family serine protease
VIGVESTDTTHTAPRNGLLFAPGTNILTLTPAGGYDFMSGSSLAAASVSGGVALMLAHRHSTQRDALYAALAQSTHAESVNLCAAMTTLDPRTRCAID